MKKVLLITLALASLGGMTQAQTVYEAAKLNEEDIDGLNLIALPVQHFRGEPGCDGNKWRF